MFAFRMDEPVGAGFRRIASEEIDKAREDLTGDGFDDAVHDARKRLKRLRGLIRLVRPALGKDYRRLNVHFRDAQRRLSETRDLGATIETVERLGDEEPAAKDRLAAVADRLRGRRGQAEGDAAHRRRLLERADADLAEAVAMVDAAGLDAVADVLAKGLAQIYARARDEGERSRRRPADDALLHLWRKRVKYHWLHLTLVAPVWPAVIEARAGEAKRLSDLTGRHHDLSVLAAALERTPDDFGDADDHALLARLADDGQARLGAEAHDLGRRLFLERPAAFRSRFGGLFDLAKAA